MPGFGAAKNLSFRDIVDLLVQSMEFLVGGGSDDAVDSCSGGLLGRQILGVNVFTYQIPGEYKMCRVCSARLFLVTHGLYAGVTETFPSASRVTYKKPFSIASSH
jgi:hypothetical protein